MSKRNIHLSSLLSLIVVAIVGRLIPHPPNFTPVISIALLTSMYYPRYISGIITLIAFILSDIILGFAWISPWVYLSVTLIALAGPTFKGKLSETTFFKKIFLSSVAGSVAFFILTNFFVWCFGHMYSFNFSGLWACYVAAIPFFTTTLLGTLFYSYVLFGINEFLFKMRFVPHRA